MVVPISVHDIGITLWTKLTFVPGANNYSIKLKTKFKFRSNPTYRLDAYLRQRKRFPRRNRNLGQVV